MKFITTSWDDGDTRDFRIAELLNKYNLTGTFYIPRANAERPVMKEVEIAELSKQFEIGGHTLNHIRLDTHNSQLIQNEVAGCYHWLSDLLGYTPVSFCFPLGKYNDLSKKLVHNAGFKFARTTELLKVDKVDTAQVHPTTLQLFEHSRFTYIKHLLKRGRLTSLPNILRLKTTAIELLVKDFLEKVPGDGCFHLWGHSWEIEEYHLWSKLEDVFKILSNVPAFAYSRNKDLPYESVGIKNPFLKYT